MLHHDDQDSNGTPKESHGIFETDGTSTQSPGDVKLPPELRTSLGADWKPSPINRVAEPSPHLATDHDPSFIRERAVKWLAKCDESVQSQKGSDKVLWAARCVAYGFNLGSEVAYELLATHYNPHCSPPWNEGELRRKCEEGNKNDFGKPRGWLLLESNSKGRPEGWARSSHASHSGPPDDEHAVATPADLGPCKPPTKAPVNSSLRNFREISNEDGSKTNVPTTTQSIIDKLISDTGGWPKSCDERLLVCSPKHEIKWINDSATFFAWASLHYGQTGGWIDWARGKGLIDKQEFVKSLSMACDNFDDVQTTPNFPPLPRTLYVHQPLPSPGSGAFDELLAMFSPATELDRQLIRAFFLTLPWGGLPGRRPVFLCESAVPKGGRTEQGAGKSTVVIAGGRLLGSHINFDLASACDEDIQKRLLSPMGRKSRLVVFDNFRGIASSSLIESYITSDQISGKQMYQGEGQRANYITWAITANSPCLTKDFAQRVIPIRILPADYSPDWDRKLQRIIETQRLHIFADILSELQGPSLGSPPKWSRWQIWEDEVFSRVVDLRSVNDKGETIIQQLDARRGELDNDASITSIVREKILEAVRRKFSSDPEKIWCVIPPDALAAIARSECTSRNSQSTNAVTQFVSRLRIHGLTKTRTNAKRIWEWRGADSIAEVALEWDAIPL